LGNDIIDVSTDLYSIPNLDKPEKLKVKRQRSKVKVKTVDASIKK